MNFLDIFLETNEIDGIRGISFAQEFDSIGAIMFVHVFIQKIDSRGATVSVLYMKFYQDIASMLYCVCILYCIVRATDTDTVL